MHPLFFFLGAVMTLEDPIFYALSSIDLLFLVAIATCWSGLVWLITEAVKDRAQWTKPHPPRRRLFLSWTPPVISGVATIPLLPFILQGLGQKVTVDIQMISAAFCIGVASGLASKIAHDRAGDLLRAATDRLARVIRGGSK